VTVAMPRSAAAALVPAAAAAGLLFLATSLALRFSGLTPSLPWGLLALISIAGVPLAACIDWLLRYEKHRGRLLNWPTCLAVSAAILLGWHYVFVWPLLAIALWLGSGTKLQFRNGTALALALTVLVCGFGVVWNVNYLLMRYMSPHRWDPVIRSLDLQLYGWWLGSSVDLTAFFPLVSNQILLRLFDNAYAFLIPEVVLVAFLLAQDSKQPLLSSYLQRLFGLYLVGTAIYILFPVNGPHLYYPEQQDLARSLPGTVALANGMMHDYRVAKVGGQLVGFGYFIAVPSLHVLVAVFLQHCLVPFRALFRILLPINVTLCLSTVVLGYHYVFDVAAAAAVYLVLVASGLYPYRSRVLDAPVLMPAAES
jgi:hypothetical protein